MSELSGANLVRGELLLDRNRFEEALPYFQAALAEVGPEDGYVLARIAICEANITGRCAKALQTIDAAIGAEPGEADHFRIKALILLRLKRPKEALEAVAYGISIDPGCPNLRSAEAEIHLVLGRWDQAEESARMALAIDPEHEDAANQLVQALYERRDGNENQVLVMELLARNPNDARAHYNAGYGRLQSGDPGAALEHFVECLRLDPDFPPGRAGLLEAMRARYAIYRWYLKLYFALDSRAKRMRRHELLLPLVAPFIGLVAMIHAVASFFLLFDRRARLAMRVEDKLGALLGGITVLGIVLVAVGLSFGAELAWKLGGVLLATTFLAGFMVASEVSDQLRM